MSTHPKNNISTDTVTQSVVPKMTKAELIERSDEELLNLVDKAKGHTGNDFGDFMNCDFSYSFLTNVLKERGFENGWHKAIESTSVSTSPEVILMRKSNDEVVRSTYMIEKSIADEWKKFNENVPYKTVTLGHALNRFMDDYKAGKIKFEFEI